MLRNCGAKVISQYIAGNERFMHEMMANVEIKNTLDNLAGIVVESLHQLPIAQHIIPGIVILVAIISMFVLGHTYNQQPEMHRLKSREFIIHTIGSMTLFCFVSMSILMCGGIKSVVAIYDVLHSDVWEPLKESMPLVVSLSTTMLGLLLTFRLIRPRVAIYPLAAYEVINGKYWLTFQVRNLGWLECIDMKVDLYECHFEQRDGVVNKVMKPIKLEPLAQSTMIDWKYGDSNDNTYLIEVSNNTFERNVFKESGKFLELRVKLTHPLSRITKVFVRDYTSHDIHYGEFIEYNLRRYRNGDKQKVVNKLLKKDIMWRTSRYLKVIEATLILLAFIGMTTMLVLHNSDKTLSYDCVEWSFYGFCMAIAIAEIIRQYFKRPTKSQLEDTNI